MVLREASCDEIQQELKNKYDFNMDKEIVYFNAVSYTHLISKVCGGYCRFIYGRRVENILYVSGWGREKYSV